jgi:hypothetical protein
LCWPKAGLITVLVSDSQVVTSFSYPLFDNPSIHLKTADNTLPAPRFPQPLISIFDKLSPSFQPGAPPFQPSQNFQQYGGGYEQPGYQNYYNAQAGQGYGYPQYGQQGSYNNQFPPGGYNAGYNQGAYNQTYGENLTQSQTPYSFYHIFAYRIC